MRPERTADRAESCPTLPLLLAAPLRLPSFRPMSSLDDPGYRRMPSGVLADLAFKVFFQRFDDNFVFSANDDCAHDAALDPKLNRAHRQACDLCGLCRVDEHHFSGAWRQGEV